MTIPDKYNIPKASWIAMVRDGIVTSKVSRAEDIISCYHRKKSAGHTHAKAIQITAVEMDCSDRWVYEILNKYA